jgi:hypothetical protein
MKRVILATATVALALALTFLLSGALAASPQNLSAEGMITNLRMSDTPSGAAKVNFPPGTTQMVYASFDYSNPSGTLIGTLTVKDDLATIFQNSHSYTGSGTQTFAIRGTDIFTAYLQAAQSNGIAMTGYITQAQVCTNTVCVTQTVPLATNEGTRMQAKLLRAQTFTNTPACLAAIVSATAAVSSTLSEGQTIMGLTSLSEMQAHLSLMLGHANNANSYVQQAIANVNGSIENAFPTTPPCGWRYTTSVSADTGGGPSVADSVEWTVGTPTGPVQANSSLSAQPSSMPPGGTSAIEAVFRDNACIVVADGTSVSFSATAGNISPPSTSTTNGVANATFTAPAQVGRAVITAIAGGVPITTAVSYGPAQVLLSAFPTTIPVNGRPYGGVSGLSAELRDANGVNIGYDVPITFTTTLGKFENGSTVYATTASGGHGFATLISENKGGVATITVNAGTASVTTTVTIQYRVYLPVVLKRFSGGW